MRTALGEGIERWLEPQERFESLRARAARTGRLIDLAYPNVPGPPHPLVRQALREALDGDGDGASLQYTPYGGATVTRRLIARQLAASHGEPFAWRNVVLTPGAMAALNLLFRALACRPERREVVVVTPCWMDYPPYLENLGLRPVLVPVREDTLRLDVDRIRDALSERTGALVLSQPANPTGILYGDAEISDLATALEACPGGEPPLWIADECHRDYVLPSSRFRSPLERYAECCVVYSFGKGLQVQGQRLGYVAVSPRLRDAEGFSRLLERLCRLMGFCTPTALMQLAVRALLDFRPDLAGLARKRARVLAALEGSGGRVVPSDGTWFLYPRTAGGDDFAHVEDLARRGVLVLPAAVFWHAGHVRISLTAADEDLEAALPVLCESWQKAAGRR
jgi:aspartate aminotransferase